MVFNPPLRNAPWRKRAPVAAKRPIPRIDRKEMISRRDRCLGRDRRRDVAERLEPNAIMGYTR